MAVAGTRPRRNRRGGGPDRDFGYDVAVPPRTIVPITTGPLGTPVLDDFETTANQNLTARTGWGGAVLVNGDTTMKTDGLPHNAVGNNLQSNYWGTIGGVQATADQEGWCQMAAFSQPSAATYIGSRVTANGAAFTLYSVEINVTTFKLARWVSAALTYLGGSLTQTVVEGDGVAVTCQGSRIRTWYQAQGSGTWTVMHDLTDTAITGNGTPFGYITRGTTTSISVMGGGDLSSYHHNSGFRRVWTGR